MTAPYIQNEIPFYKLSPGGNTTILVPARAVPAAKRAETARRLMDPLHLGAEQVGFIDLAGEMPSLEMMGGELCGNACRALAALRVMLAADEFTDWPVTGNLHSSGTDALVAWRVRPASGEAAALDAAVRITLAHAAVTELEPGLRRVDMPGIVHVLLDETLHPAPRDAAAEAAAWRRKLNLQDLPAVGCIRHAPLDAPAQYITPLVWVRDTDSSCPETACGSGTLALGLALHLHSGQSCVHIRQPSGAHIAVDLEQDSSGILHGWIGGPVRLIAQGKTYYW